MWLLHKNYAVNTKLSNSASIVPKCPKDTSAPVPKCRDTSDIPKCPRSDVWKVWSVLGPKCPGSEVSVHPRANRPSEMPVQKINTHPIQS